MKIAICISGQLRTWEKCYKSWMKLFDLELLKQIKLNQLKHMGIQASEIQKMKKSFQIQVPTTGCSEDTSRPKWSRTPVVDIPLQVIWDLNLNDSIACYNECVRNPKIEIDYFVHTWDYNSVSAGRAQTQKKTQKLLTKSELDEFKNIVKPKKILIEDKKASYNKIRWSKDDKPLIGYLRSMLYSMFKVAELKKQYEKENNFEYDVCVRIRPDLFFDEGGIIQMLGSFNIPRDNFIHTVHCGYDGEFPYFYVGDIFYYANSKTFDIISDFYNRIDDIDVGLFKREMGSKPNSPDMLFNDLITTGGKKIGKKKELGNNCVTAEQTRTENLFAYYLMESNIKVRPLPGGPYCTGSSIFLDNPEDRKRLKKYGF